jgi:carbonic anhydrase/acetyltransferase-like protein (isoleucine patch superfamily)
MTKPLIRPVRGIIPQIDPSVFIAENAVIIGDVVIGPQSSIWYNVVIRGDVHSIRIGARSNIQDGAIVHCTYQKAKTTIGDNVTVGHGAIVHGCTLQDFVLIGMGAKVLDHAVVETESVVAAGSVVLERTVVESGWLYAGVPAKKVKPLSPEQIAGLRKYADGYVMYSDWFRQGELIG